MLKDTALCAENPFRKKISCASIHHFVALFWFVYFRCCYLLFRKEKFCPIYLDLWTSCLPVPWAKSTFRLCEQCFWRKFKTGWDIWKTLRWTFPLYTVNTGWDIWKTLRLTFPLYTVNTGRDVWKTLRLTFPLYTVNTGRDVWKTLRLTFLLYTVKTGRDIWKTLRLTFPLYTIVPVWLSKHWTYSVR